MPLRGLLIPRVLQIHGEIPMPHKPIFVRAAYNYDMDKASLDNGLTCNDKTLAQQHFKEECDINTIVERFGLTGEVPTLQQLPAYQDYEGIFDFQTAMNQVRLANEEFMTLPAKIRARFNNEPQRFLEFCADDDNRDEARKLGLLKPIDPDTLPTATQQPAENANYVTGTASRRQSPPEGNEGSRGTETGPDTPQATKKPR